MTKKEKQFIENMKRLRGMDFVRIGMMVEVNGNIGTVMGMSPSANLIVVFANQLKHGKDEKRCHPTWKTRYFDLDGNVIAEYAEGD
jgi:membrane carboxypeptidase/penicillin-binding protein